GGFAVLLGAKLGLQSMCATSSGPIVSPLPLVVARHGHAATVVPGGRVFVVGGVNTNGVVGSVEIYGPVTRAFTSAGVLVVPRAGHTATLLANGRVLIAGGQNAAGVENSAEVFDPATGVSGLVGFMNSPRSGHTATVLAD